jgi:hypothetical protein
MKILFVINGSKRVKLDHKGSHGKLEGKRNPNGFEEGRERNPSQLARIISLLLLGLKIRHKLKRKYDTFQNQF